MQEGREIARNLLIMIRATNPSADKVAGWLGENLPPSEPSRRDFLLVIGAYIASALAGAPIDPERL